MACFPLIWSVETAKLFHVPHKDHEVAQPVLEHPLRDHHRLDDVCLLAHATTGRVILALEGHAQSVVIALRGGLHCAWRCTQPRFMEAAQRGQQQGCPGRGENAQRGSATLCQGARFAK